jgi:hypothetical protein
MAPPGCRATVGACGTTIGAVESSSAGQARAATPKDPPPGDGGARSAGQLKQEILRVYNAVNQSIAGVGVRRQRVDLLGDRILIVAEHQRIPALAALDPTRRSLTREVDIAIVDESKHRLTAGLEEALGIRILTILKDYDPGTQLAGTLVLLEEPLEVS